MDQAKIIRKLRGEIGDNQEPYKILPEQINDLIEGAVEDYSGHRPRKKKGKIILEPGKTEYPLPDDCQTWLSGLEGCEVIGNVFYLEPAPLSTREIPIAYLAVHTVETVPNRDSGLILDHCMWKLLSDIVREGAEISGLKLGKGLEIKFDNFDEITKIATQRLNNYKRNIKQVAGGCT
jgi:hypothetical protein